MPAPSVEVERDQGGRRAAGRLDLVVQRLQRALGAADGDDLCPGLSQGQGAGAADAARRAGDERDAVRRAARFTGGVSALAGARA